jgi:hypothetical protein
MLLTSISCEKRASLRSAGSGALQLPKVDVRKPGPCGKKGRMPPQEALHRDEKKYFGNKEENGK